MTDNLIKTGNVDTDTHTGRMPCKGEGRDWEMLPQVMEHQALPANHQKFRLYNEKFAPQSYPPNIQFPKRRQIILRLCHFVLRNF